MSEQTLEEFDLEFEEEDVIEDSQEQEDTQSTETETPETEETAETAEEEDNTSSEEEDERPKRKRKRRTRDTARYRINQLLGENKEKEEELKTRANEVRELKKLLLSQAAQSAQHNAATYEGRISELENEISRAIEEGDESRKFKAERELAKTERELARHKSEADDYTNAVNSIDKEDTADTTTKADRKQQKVEDTEETAQATADWTEDNPWFMDLAHKAQRGDFQAQKIVHGITSYQRYKIAQNPESYFSDPDGFYDTLTEELKKDPEIRSLMGGAPKTNKQVQARTPGAGSPTAAGATTGKRKFSFTKTEMESAARIGLDLKDAETKRMYAQECLKARKASN